MKRRNRTDVATKANRLLQGILIALMIILFRLWHLAVIDHEKKLEEASRPERRIVIERPERARIFDRFGLTLANNSPEYRASIVYSDVREIPRFEWRVDDLGNKIKVQARKEYISKLALKLEEELGLDHERMEELIHGKAALLGTAPLVIKENLTEKEFIRLKILEKDFPGIRAEMATGRLFPMHRLASHLIGFLGPISKCDYDDLIGEMKQLRGYLAKTEDGDEEELPTGFSSAEEVRLRLEILEKRAYTLADEVGKSGVEKGFEGHLRGLCGKKAYLADAKGNFLREIPPSLEKESGKPLFLTISSELQAYAEELLMQYESLPPTKFKTPVPPLFPWIKGGAIVVMDPNNGEILALASYPRFDPNDFVKGRNPKEVRRWLESESYIAALWDGRESLKRERIDSKTCALVEEKREIDWESYLQFTLPKESKIYEKLTTYKRVKEAIELQKNINDLLALFADSALSPYKILEGLFHDKNQLSAREKKIIEEKKETKGAEIASIKESLLPYFSGLSQTVDCLLLVDLYRLVVDVNRLSPSLTDKIKEMDLAEYRRAERESMILFDLILPFAKKTYRETHFKKWKEEEGKSFLAAIRKKEKEKNKVAKAAFDLFDEEEKSQFNLFWQERKEDLLLLFLKREEKESDEVLKPFLDPFSAEWERGQREKLCWVEVALSLKRVKGGVEKELLKGFRSYNDLVSPLLASYSQLRCEEGKRLQKHLAAAFYPKSGFGFSHAAAFQEGAPIGSIFKLVTAYAALTDQLKKGEKVHNPFTFIDDKKKIGQEWIVGYTPEGHKVPRYYHGGLLPRSDHAGVGKVDLVSALAVSSNPYFALLAGEYLSDPEDLVRAARLLGFGEKTGIDLPGEMRGNLPTDIAYNRTGLYSFAFGQHTLIGTPLQTAVMLSAIVNGGKILKPKIAIDGNGAEVKREVSLPLEVQNYLEKGMREVIHGERGTAIAMKKQFPEDIGSIMGKTSTAETIEVVSLDSAYRCAVIKQVAFGAIAFDEKRPELVVIVSLRRGDYGRMAAPYAVRLIKKWREIERARQNQSSDE